jgi:putative oxidoreductase
MKAFVQDVRFRRFPSQGPTIECDVADAMAFATRPFCIRAGSFTSGSELGDVMTLAAMLILIGRVVLGLFFVIAGVRNFLHFSERIAAETNYGWKLPALVTGLGFASQLVGGLSVSFGILTAWGAGLLILFLVSATALFHNFMMFKGEAQAPHLYSTLVNSALVGYCLLVIGTAL